MRSFISEFSTYRGHESAEAKNLPNAYKMEDSEICLPMHHELAESGGKGTLHLYQ